MARKALTTVFALAMFATAAQAGVIETSSTRSNRALIGMDGSSDSPAQVFGPSIYGAFDDTTTAALTTSDGDATGTADQDSTIAPLSYTADLSAFATISYQGFQDATVVAESEFIVAFTVDSSVDYSIDGAASISGSGSGVSVSLVRIGGVGTPSQTFVNMNNTTNNVVIDTDGSLLPGNYELRASTQSGFDLFFDTGTFTGNAATNFTMTLTPEPSSLALIALGGFTALRRRRRVA